MATWQHVVLLVLFFASLQPHGSKLDFSTSGDHPHTARFLSLFDFSSPQLCCAAHIRFLNIPPPLSHCHCLPAYHFVCVASTAWFKLDFSSSSDYPHAPRHIHIPTPYTQSIAFILSLSYMRPVTPSVFCTWLCGAAHIRFLNLRQLLSQRHHLPHIELSLSFIL